MKTKRISPILGVACLVVLVSLRAKGQTTQVTQLDGSALIEPRVLSLSPPAVVERGPHHAITEVTRQIEWADGRVEWATNRYTELGNGMNVLDANGE